jgi:hypothetical protein
LQLFRPQEGFQALPQATPELFALFALLAVGYHPECRHAFLFRKELFVSMNDRSADIMIS